MIFMEKNTYATGQQCGVQLIPSDLVEAFGVIDGKLLISMAKFGEWIKIDEVPGTLSVVCTSDGLNPVSYTISGKFRISFDSLSNQKTIEQLSRYPVLLKYRTGGWKTKIAGTKEFPLRLTYSTIENFDGYECTLSGIQPQPECFI